VNIIIFSSNVQFAYEIITNITLVNFEITGSE